MNSLEHYVIDILEKSKHTTETPSTMVVAYWLIGKAIVHEIETTQADGKMVLKELSDLLMPQYGINFSIRTLQFSRKLYKLYPTHVTIENPLRDKWEHDFKPNLSWSHYRTLTRIENSDQRNEFEEKASTLNWSKKQLKRHTRTLK